MAVAWLIRNGGVNEPVFDSSVGEVDGGCLEAQSTGELVMLQPDVRRVGRRMVEGSCDAGG
jgi:hypothetical protein